MNVTLRPTAKIVLINGATARIWEGVSDRGVPVTAIIPRICPETLDPRELQIWDDELIGAEAPQSIVGQAIDIRLVI